MSVFYHSRTNMIGSFGLYVFCKIYRYTLAMLRYCLHKMYLFLLFFPYRHLSDDCVQPNLVEGGLPEMTVLFYFSTEKRLRIINCCTYLLPTSWVTNRYETTMTNIYTSIKNPPHQHNSLQRGFKWDPGAVIISMKCLQSAQTYNLILYLGFQASFVARLFMCHIILNK